jgi:hypothetical protein
MPKRKKAKRVIFFTVQVEASLDEFDGGDPEVSGIDTEEEMLNAIRDELVAGLEERDCAAFIIDEGDTAPGCANCNATKED